MARPGLTRLGAKQWMPVLLLFSCVVFSAQFKVSRPLFAPSPMRQGTQREHEGARWRILGGADYGTIGPGMHGRRIRVLPSCSRRARAPGLELKMAREDKLASFLDDLLCQVPSLYLTVPQACRMCMRDVLRGMASAQLSGYCVLVQTHQPVSVRCILLSMCMACCRCIHPVCMAACFCEPCSGQCRRSCITLPSSAMVSKGNGSRGFLGTRA